MSTRYWNGSRRHEAWRVLSKRTQRKIFSKSLCERIPFGGAEYLDWMESNPLAEVPAVRRILTGYGVISLLLSVAMILGAVNMFTSVADYQNPYPVSQDFSVNRRGPALAEHVVLVIVDGLRLEAADSMRSFNFDPASARTSVALVGQPSYSKPTWSVICTGADQAVTGVLMNDTTQPFISNIFSEAKASGRSTALVGSDWWEPLVGQWADQKHIYVFEEPEAVTVANTVDFAKTAALTISYFATPDEVAHQYGATSKEYADSVVAVDAAIQDILAQLDLTTTTVIVTADHGHIDAGGHGGPETAVVGVPIAFFGARVAPGPALAIRQTDIAPTVAALLGTSFPDFVQGQPLLDAFTIDPLDCELILANWAAQVEKGTVALLPTLGATATTVTTSDPDQRAAAFRQQFDQAIAQRAAADMWSPLRALAAAAIIGAGLGLAIALRRKSSATAMLGSLAGLAAVLVAAAAGPLRPSFSVLAGATGLVITLSIYAGCGMIVVLAAMLVARQARRTVAFSQWAAALIQVQIVWFALAFALHVLRGPFLVSAYMPDFTYWLLKVYVSAYAALGNVVLLIGLVPLYFLSRWAVRTAPDCMTRIAPPPAGMN